MDADQPAPGAFQQTPPVVPHGSTDDGLASGDSGEPPLLGQSLSVATTVDGGEGDDSTPPRGAAVGTALEPRQGDDCEAMLDTLDSCVACAEGVDAQARFEAEIESTAVAAMTTVATAALRGKASSSSSSRGAGGGDDDEEDHGLSEEAAALVRLQIMEREQEDKRREGSSGGGASSAAGAVKTDEGDEACMVDNLNLCGDDGIEGASECFADVGAGMPVSVMGGYESAAAAAALREATTPGAPLRNLVDDVSTVLGGTGEASVHSASTVWRAGGVAPRGGDDTSSVAMGLEPSEAAGGQEERLHCAICYDEGGTTSGIATSPSGSQSGGLSMTFSAVTFVYLPCCGSDGREESSTTKVCASCILLLTMPTSDGTARIGRCPRCRHWISVTVVTGATSSSTENGGGVAGGEGFRVAQATENEPGAGDLDGSDSSIVAASSSGSGIVAVPTKTDRAAPMSVVVSPVSNAGQCTICNQVKDQLVDGDGSICDACYLGRRRPLLYECEQCGGSQRIPHPMYRYQPNVGAYGRTSWACHGPCKNFTMWRILPNQVRLIPVGDAPVEWREDYLEIARARVMEARRGIVAGDQNGGVNNESEDGWGTSCIIS